MSCAANKAAVLQEAKDRGDHQRDALGLRGEQDDEEGHDEDPGRKEEEDAPLRNTRYLSLT